MWALLSLALAELMGMVGLWRFHRRHERRAILLYGHTRGHRVLPVVDRSLAKLARNSPARERWAARHLAQGLRRLANLHCLEDLLTVGIRLKRGRRDKPVFHPQDITLHL